MDRIRFCCAGVYFGSARAKLDRRGRVEETIRIIECPRDAWQGLPDMIPTEYKAAYLKELVLAGFKHIDAVSFVSPKHVKQMADSEDVMARFNSSLPSDGNPPEI